MQKPVGRSPLKGMEDELMAKLSLALIIFLFNFSESYRRYQVDPIL